MTKTISKYVCQSCAYESPRWIGKCPNCGTWNSFVEEVSSKSAARKLPHSTKLKGVPLEEIELRDDHRTTTNITEFDRVLGGGIVDGSVILIGGDPGVGKSTLMMQIASHLNGKIILYVSGEESARQIKVRAERLKFPNIKSFLVLAETNLDLIIDVIERTPPDILIVDSIQTMFRPQLESSAGSVGQVRECTGLFTRIAKEKSIPVFLIGHVTKDGVIAGPKVIEHVVDTVLQFEGERHYAYRILRVLKNRFGSTNEIGVFEMRENGLEEVKNPSEVFLSERSLGAAGSTVVASIEGTRPILIEVQALVTPTNYGIPQRNTTGLDYRRLSLLLAVLEKRVGMQLGQQDVFVNIAGGITIDEPAVDLGIASSIISSMRDIPVDTQTVAVGEIGLGGEVRTVSNVEKRVQEAAKLGFQRIVIPKNNFKEFARFKDIEIIGVERIDEAIKILIS
ncbi:MAG: DNA repair protein RadA [Ignavibacteriales bacterium]|nr:DNA repair protein RadA [Ignavibacteriales bacterium]